MTYMCHITEKQTSGSSERDIHRRLWFWSPFLCVLNNVLSTQVKDKDAESVTSKKGRRGTVLWDMV